MLLLVVLMLLLVLLLQVLLLLTNEVPRDREHEAAGLLLPTLELLLLLPTARWRGGLGASPVATDGVAAVVATSRLVRFAERRVHPDHGERREPGAEGVVRRSALGHELGLRVVFFLDESVTLAAELANERQKLLVEPNGLQKRLQSRIRSRNVNVCRGA